MARRADVVIGSAYGDEGKGLVTDVLVSQRPKETIVVRFNGGAQAGHTVVTPEGQRHVFSHFGSGTFAGAATLLSRFFVVNPILFHREREQLKRRGALPKVYIDPRAMVTTPFDMFVNTALERHRGSARHGSCGIGFGETVGRSEGGTFALTMEGLTRPDCEQRLRAIRDEWLPGRLAELGVQMTEAERATLLSDALLANFMDDVAGMAEAVTLADEEILRAASHVVFEGAQGLLLDQDMGYFPHVTRSNTGLRNVGTLSEAAGITSLDVHYVLRPYLTRHGAGPLPGELGGPPYAGIVDHTNIPNDWQGSLRFAVLNLDLLRSSIERDSTHSRLPPGIALRRRVAVTCLDQVAEDVRFIESDREVSASPAAFVRRCLKAASTDHALAGYGATRSTCIRVEIAQRPHSAGSRSSRMKFPPSSAILSASLTTADGKGETCSQSARDPRSSGMRGLRRCRSSSLRSSPVSAVRRKS